MNNIKNYKLAILAGLLFCLVACNTMTLQNKEVNAPIPDRFSNTTNDNNAGVEMKWKTYFSDVYLQKLIDSALANNQEMNIVKQEIEISRFEIQARKGEYLPFVTANAGIGVDKKGRYTNIGAMEANTEIKPGKEMPDPLLDFGFGAVAHWETDIWGKLHNATKAQVSRYLATKEGKNFMQTQLVAEIANSYYELLALDKELQIVEKNITIQNNAYSIVKSLKENARSNELAVKRFHAQVLKTQSMQFGIRQKIVETENKINFLVGRYPQPVARSTQDFDDIKPTNAMLGLPQDLLQNRPDIKQAEALLAATKLDVKSARARFYPNVGLSAGIGFSAFNPVYLIKPQSLLYSLVGDLVAPLVNKNAIKAAYSTANAKQIQAVYSYEQSVLKAYTEVVNQIAKVDNLQKSFVTQSKEVDELTKSISIANDLFKFARADYMEVLLTQRDALEAKFDLVETKVNQLKATVALYKALGGGWEIPAQ